jgi:hypothetical protein
MRAQASLSTGRRYPLTWICGLFRVPRPTVYATQVPRATPPPRVPQRKPGPRGDVHPGST